MAEQDRTRSTRPPESTDQVERALLGVLLILGANALELIQRLRPAHFRSSHRAAVFTAVLRLSFLQAPIHALSVAHELERGSTPPPPGRTWALATAELLEDGYLHCSPDDETVKWAAKIIEEEAQRRQLRALTPLADVLPFTSREAV